MNKKTSAIILTIIGLLLIIIGLSLTVFENINNKNDNKKGIETKIVENYETFKSKIDNFNNVRDQYYNDVAKNLYPESVESDYSEWIKSLDNYTVAVDDVVNVSDYLKDSCVNKYYSSTDTKNKCVSFIIAYETAVNYYTKDIYAFNDNLSLYRRNTVDANDSITDYKVKYNYVDIDSDGKFYGKD